MTLRDRKRLPAWLRKATRSPKAVHDLKRSLRTHALHTICEEARCPNRDECFARGTATILVMGNRCTRHCGFCNVESGLPKPLDPKEPLHVAEQVKQMALAHVVLTSVTRDDLADGGAAHMASTIACVQRHNPGISVEVLTSDFQGDAAAIREVCEESPNVFAHNLETVRHLTPRVRSHASYDRSLEVLRIARNALRHGLIKSSIMVGLGENSQEVAETIQDLAQAGADIVTIGQYLQPSRQALPVEAFVEPHQFEAYQAIGLKSGIKQMFCGPFVRSSYCALELMQGAKAGGCTSSSFEKKGENACQHLPKR